MKTNYKVKKFIKSIQGHKVRDWMVWGTYGKSGKETFKWITLKDMSDEHITAILTTQHQINRFYRKEFKRELKFRNQYSQHSIKES
jgi:hypothetical protein